MKKKILFIRHAKSSWDNVLLADYDRPLNERGHQNAPIMAKKIANEILSNAFIITSPALRALQTAEYFIRAWQIQQENVIQLSNLYEGDPEDYLNAFTSMSESVDTLVFFGHNPALDEICNSIKFCPVVHVPTCGVIISEIENIQWTEITFAEIRYVEHVFPKMLI
ncbi:MAG: histidine phosphatase family protein [Bacteroidota bacterium]|nr:histidine phosphatase family protein [Bacteroidota bacterium]